MPLRGRKSVVTAGCSNAATEGDEDDCAVTACGKALMPIPPVLGCLKERGGRQSRYETLAIEKRIGPPHSTEKGVYKECDWRSLKRLSFMA